MGRTRLAGYAQIAVVLGLVWVPVAGARQGEPAADAGQTIAQLLDHERLASTHRGRYRYTSEERSDRTGGHLWLEHVAETAQGKLRCLVAEDGVPLSGERAARERARLEGEAADPEGFARAEAARTDDEQHARQMLELLPKAFLFDPPRVEGESLRIGYRPNPAYEPRSMEEKVLHAMTGTVLIDRASMRLRGIDGTLPADLSVSFGLANIKAGSTFSTVREHVDGDDWKTETVHTDIRGRALLLKTIARQQDARHRDFHRLEEGTTLPAAVRLLVP